MKILVEGKIPKKTKRFKCGNCGCEFEADEGEYKNADQWAYLHDGIECQCECPCCHKMVYK